MNEVSADEELRATVRENSDGVGVPYFLKKAFSHGVKWRRGWRRAGKLHRDTGNVKAACGPVMRKISAILPGVI